QLLDHLKVPHHRAPAEAEAECARLQRLGIVDAVWSDDGDTLMFGATCLIGAHRVGSKWDPDKITVLRAEKILKDHDFDSESLVLFAMLSGTDYNTQVVASTDCADDLPSDDRVKERVSQEYDDIKNHYNLRRVPTHGVSSKDHGPVARSRSKCGDVGDR
ncbi:hypothetical protein EON64_12800, partial [archaeon]